MMVTRDSGNRLQGILVCTNWQAVEAWIERLSKVGCNHFVVFTDVRGPALQFGYSEWVARETYANRYVCR